MENLSEDEIKEKIKNDLEDKSGYRFVGKHRHSAAKICEWTKKSLRGDGVCYKQKWYGIESHRCLQCTLSLFCMTRCVYCWRSFKAFIGEGVENPIDEPKEILNGLIKAQRSLLSGFGGNKNVDPRKFKEAMNPTNFAISLVGESIVYPRISEFMREVHKMGGSTFLVTKGTSPEKLEELDEKPTNLYISLCAPDEETFLKVDRPVVKDAWERQMRSLELMKTFDSSRRIIRMTLVKGWNMKDPDKYAKLIEKAEPDFIEPKAYMHVGESQQRLPMSAMPSMEDVKKFAKEIADSTGYKYKDEFEPSRVVLLSKK